MDLEDEQSEEMIRLVQYISDSDVGLSELEKIYQEADEAGDGKGIVLKNTWENDVAMFYSDQHQNSMLNCYCTGFKLVYSNRKTRKQMVIGYNSHRFVL